MIPEFDEPTGRISAQFPDVFLTLYPAGHKVVDGKEEFYRGALTVSRGSERVHLNALDIQDVITFLRHPDVIRVRKVMTNEYVATNLLRALVIERDFDDEPEVAL